MGLSSQCHSPTGRSWIVRLKKRLIFFRSFRPQTDLALICMKRRLVSPEAEAEAGPSSEAIKVAELACLDVQRLWDGCLNLVSQFDYWRPPQAGLDMANCRLKLRLQGQD